MSAERLERLRGRRDERQAAALGAYCVVCGRGPFTKVGSHTRQMHGISSREYRRQFPGALMTHPDLREAFYREGVDKGFRPGGHRRRTCLRGHPLREGNVIMVSGARACRQCFLDQRRAKRRTARGLTPDTPCPACGELFVGARGLGRHRAACPVRPLGRQPGALRSREHRARAKGLIADSPCPGCGEMFAGDYGVRMHRRHCPGRDADGWLEWMEDAARRRRLHQEPDTACSGCGEMFVGARGLRTHRRYCPGPTRYLGH